MVEKNRDCRLSVFFDKRLDLDCCYHPSWKMCDGMKKYISIIVLIFLSSNLFCQNSIGVKYQPVKIELPHFGQMISPLRPSSFLLKQHDTNPNIYVYAKSPPIMEKAYHFKDLALFCRLEVQMEKAAKFPVKFRLGEVQYVDRMEGKY